jgi:hypothetical protein
MPEQVVVSGDTAWAHRRNADQSGEALIVHTREPHWTNGKILDFETTSRTSVDPNYHGSSAGMEGENSYRLGRRLTGESRIIAFVHDQDTKQIAAFRSAGWLGLQELLDAGHVIKTMIGSVLDKFDASITVPAKKGTATKQVRALSALRDGLTKHCRWFVAATFPSDERSASKPGPARFSTGRARIRAGS